jgi:hypothetical protein
MPPPRAALGEPLSRDESQELMQLGFRHDYPVYEDQPDLTIEEVMAAAARSSFSAPEPLMLSEGDLTAPVHVVALRAVYQPVADVDATTDPVERPPGRQFNEVPWWYAWGFVAEAPGRSFSLDAEVHVLFKPLRMGQPIGASMFQVIDPPPSPGPAGFVDISAQLRYAEF